MNIYIYICTQHDLWYFFGTVRAPGAPPSRAKEQDEVRKGQGKHQAAQQFVLV